MVKTVRVGTKSIGEGGHLGVKLQEKRDRVALMFHISSATHCGFAKLNDQMRVSI